MQQHHKIWEPDAFASFTLRLPLLRPGQLLDRDSNGSPANFLTDRHTGPASSSPLFLEKKLRNSHHGTGTCRSTSHAAGSATTRNRRADYVPRAHV